MACKNCFKKKDEHGHWYVKRCEVCYLVDGDTTIKRVQYCKHCDAHVCTSCLGKYGRRFEAMIINARNKLRERIKK